MASAVEQQPASPTTRLGLRENWRQFVLLAIDNLFVGMLIGSERAIDLVGPRQRGLALGINEFTG